MNKNHVGTGTVNANEMMCCCQTVENMVFFSYAFLCFA